jgi:hypothetical protein
MCGLYVDSLSLLDRLVCFLDARVHAPADKAQYHLIVNELIIEFELGSSETKSS